MTTDPTIPADRQIPSWIPTVAPGWTALLSQLHEDLCVLDPEAAEHPEDPLALAKAIASRHRSSVSRL